MSQARWTRHFARSAKRGEEKKIKLYFFSSPRLALRAKCRVRLAWLIKNLLCRLVTKRVYFRSVKRATSKDFVAKKDRTTLYFLQQIFAIYNNLNCCKIGLNVASETWKRETSPLNSFCSNVAKQIARFCCPFDRTSTDRFLLSVTESDPIRCEQTSVHVQILQTVLYGNPYISLRYFVKRSIHVSFGDYCINSHNLFSWLYIDIVKRKFMWVIPVSQALNGHG